MSSYTKCRARLELKSVLWKADPSSKWKLDVEELKGMIKDNTKLIIINVPHNPSGAIIPKSQLEEIVDIAEERGITIMADEVFRPMFHSILPSDDDFPPSMVNLGYKTTVVTGSMSKAYGLPGHPGRVDCVARQEHHCCLSQDEILYHYDSLPAR